MDEKICAYCENCERRSIVEEWECRRSKTNFKYNLVTGKIEYPKCVDERVKETPLHCGKEGIYFQPIINA